MKLVVIGAGGNTGREVVVRGLLAGHDVTAAVRRVPVFVMPRELLEKAKERPDEVPRIVIADVLDQASLAAAIAGADAVISTIGPARPRKPGTLLSAGIANIVSACEMAGVKRFVYESGLIAGFGKGLGVGGRAMLAIGRTFLHAFHIERRKAEEIVAASGLDYVIVRPPVLDHATPRGTYVHGVDAKVSLAKKLPHADVADFLIRAASDPALVRTIQEIGEA